MKSGPLGLQAIIGTTIFSALVIFFGETFLLQSITPRQWLTGSNYNLIHGLIDLVLVLQIVLLSQIVGFSLAGRCRADRRSVLGIIAAYLSMAFMMISMPSVMLREWLHPFLDTTFGFLRSENDTPWLYVLTPLADIEPGLGDVSRWLSSLDNAFRIAQIENMVLLSIIVFCLMLRSLYHYRSKIRMIPRRLHLAGRHITGIGHPIRTVAWCVSGFGVFATFALFYLFLMTGSPGPIQTARANQHLATELPQDSPENNPCRKNRTTKDRVYWVESRDIGMVLNRFGDRDPDAYMYVGGEGSEKWESVDTRWEAIEAQLKATGCTNWGDIDGGTGKPHVPCVALGLGSDIEIKEARDQQNIKLGERYGGTDLVQPLIMRANLGQCVIIHFRNSLSGKQVRNNGLLRPNDGFASLQLQGLAYSVEKKVGSADPFSIKSSKDAFAKSVVGIPEEEHEELILTIPIPSDPNAERAYYFSDGGGNRQRVAHGLFGALVIEPKGATYFDTESGEPLVDGIGWQAIIKLPGNPGADDKKEPDFREFVLMYHEVGDEDFAGIIDGTDNNKMTLDQIFGEHGGGPKTIEQMLGPLYRISGRAINYRSESFHHRLTQANGFEQLKSLGYSSYTFGDPATPIPRSYLGEPTKTRLMHGGSEVFHVHHLHGGADRWRRNPNADPNNDISSGLTKRPVQQVFSTHLDSQSIGPGTSYNLEHECGAGGCQQAAGDFLYHCHIGQHYLAGMWGFWRVYDTLQSAKDPLLMGPLQSPLAPVPGYSPDLAVTANKLIGETFNGTKIGDKNSLEDWVADQLPPRRPVTAHDVKVDEFWDQDASYWDWKIQNGKYVGEVETKKSWANYKSTCEAVDCKRPPLLFNLKNGRYAWPLFRPHLGKRPPFAPKGHTGTPWLPANGPTDKQVTANDDTLYWDGLCPNPKTPDRPDPNNPDDPANVIPDQHIRYYPISAVPVDIYKYDRDILTKDQIEQLKNLDNELVILRKNLEAEDDLEKKAELKKSVKLKEQKKDELKRKIGWDAKTTAGTTGQLFVLNEDIAKTKDESDVSKGTVVLRYAKDQNKESENPEDVKKIAKQHKAVQPLAIRSNVGDCTNVILTSQLKDKPFGSLTKRSKVNIHTHFVQFDPQGSDGVISGYSYEQSVRPYGEEKATDKNKQKPNDHLQRKLLSVSDDGKTIVVNQAYRLYKKIWLGIGLGEGMCGRKTAGEPWKCDPEDAFAKQTKPHTEIRLIEKLTEGVIDSNIDDCKTGGCARILLDRKLDLPHEAGEAVGVEFVQYSWYSDVDTGTVFFHDHVDFNSWDLGLVGAHIIEPEYSTWHDPETGAQVRSGTIVDIYDNNPTVEKMSIGPGQEGSFREFVLMQHKKQNAEGTFGENAATINLKAEPIQALKSDTDGLLKDVETEALVGRKGEPAYWFSSVIHGDPFTPMPRAYVGDPFVIRHLGVHDRVSAVRVTGHRFRQEHWAPTGALSDTSPIGISERFDLVLDGGAGGTQKKAGDYLYYSTTGRDMYDGAWGLIRVFDAKQNHLRFLRGLDELPLPENEESFPLLSAATDGDNSVKADDIKDIKNFKADNASPRDGICPDNSSEKRSTYTDTNGNGLHIREASIQRSDRNGFALRDTDLPPHPDILENAIVYSFSENANEVVLEPVVLRVNHGKCLQVTLKNELKKELEEITDASKGVSRAFQNRGRAGLNVGELQFDPQTSYGAAIGLNRDSSVGPGETRTYWFYADRELGTTIALNLANPVHAAKGAFGAVIVEPEDSLYRFPEEGRAFFDILDDLTFDDTTNKGGVRADIYTEGEIIGAVVDSFTDGDRTFTAQHNFREFVTVFNDSAPVIGHNAMEYPLEADCSNILDFKFEKDKDRANADRSKFKGCIGRVHKIPDKRKTRDKRLSLFSSVNYQRNRWRDRDLLNKPSWVYLTVPRTEGGEDFGAGLGEPGVLIAGPVGKKLRIRVGAPWGEQPHVFGLSGYRWRLEPEMENSEQVFSRFLAPGYSFDAEVIGGFGGPYHIDGDSLIFDNRLPFSKAGLWGLIRACSQDDRKCLGTE